MRQLVTRVADVDLSHASVLVAAELATNAIVHAGTTFTVWVEKSERLIRLEVRDGKADPPAPRTQSPLPVDGGLGLMLVERLSHEWGTIISAESKTVWAEVPI